MQVLTEAEAKGMSDVCFYVPLDRYPTKQSQIIALRKLLRKRGQDYKVKLKDNGICAPYYGDGEYRRFDPVA